MYVLREIRNLLGSYQVKAGLYHYDRGEYKQAAVQMEAALQRDPDFASAAQRIRPAAMTATACIR